MQVSLPLSPPPLPSQRLLDFARAATANHDRAHDYDHAVAVYEIAARIVQMERFELTTREARIFPYAMIGHDFRDHKMKNAMSAEALYDFYTAELGSELALAVMNIHSNCSWSRRGVRAGCGEFERVLKILQDADWIEGMRLDRCIWYSHAAFPELTEAQVRERVIAHIGEKLLLIPAALSFDSSRQIAAEKKYADELIAYME